MRTCSDYSLCGMRMGYGFPVTLSIDVLRLSVRVGSLTFLLLCAAAKNAFYHAVNRTCSLFVFLN